MSERPHPKTLDHLEISVSIEGVIEPSLHHSQIVLSRKFCLFRRPKDRTVLIVDMTRLIGIYEINLIHCTVHNILVAFGGMG